MSISSEITRISNAKTDISNAIQARGVAVSSSALIDSFAALIAQIPDADANEIWSGSSLIDEATATIYKRYFTSAGIWRTSSDSRSFLIDCSTNTRYLIMTTNPNLGIFRVGEVPYDNSDTLPTQITATNITRFTSKAIIVITTGSDTKGIAVQISATQGDARDSGIAVYELTSRS